MSGAQRIHDVALLTERAEHWKVREGKEREGKDSHIRKF